MTTEPDIDTIFLLSDGEPSVGDLSDPQLIRDDIAEMNATRNVVINTIVVSRSFTNSENTDQAVTRSAWFF